MGRQTDPPETGDHIREEFVFGSVSTSCTDPLQRFLVRHSDIFGLFFFSAHLAEHVDRVSFMAAEALAGGPSPAEEDIARLEAAKRNRHARMAQLNAFRHLQSENMCSRMVDNFMSYLCETLQAVLLKRPEMLRSAEQVRLDDVLRFKNYRELVEFLAARKINALTYGGLKDIEEFIDERLSLPLTTSNDKRTTLLIAIELRNVYTHNRGIINDLFLQRTRGLTHAFTFKKGHRYHADLDVLARLANNIYKVDFDARAAVKYRLRRTKFRPQSQTTIDKRS